MITPMEIYQREFKRKALNGLDPEDVEDFLFQVAEDMEALIKENTELKQRQGGGAPASRQEPPPAAGDQSAEALEQAQAEAARIKAKAEREARTILNQARAEAKKISQQKGGESPQTSGGGVSEHEKKYLSMLARHLSEMTLLLEETDLDDASGGLDPSTDLSTDSAPEGTGTTLLEPGASDDRE